jgi:hypothetical protein
MIVPSVGNIASTSRQVSWWSVHEYVAPVLDRIGDCPTVGTPAWCSLPDDDMHKIGAIFGAAQHWALRLELSQEARAEASKDVSAAANWPSIARKMQQRATVYIPRVAS